MAARRWIWPQPATLSEICRLTRITSTYSSHEMAEAALWRRSLSSSRGQASPSNLRQLLQFSGAKYRFLSSLAPARSSGRWVRQFGTANQRQKEQATKSHLYLVLDDNEHAFTIHKLDMDDDLDGGGSAETPLPFPERPLIRLGHQTVPRGAQFAAIGNHIIATCASTSVTITFDTKNTNLTPSNFLPEGLILGYDAAVTVGDTLYAFESFTNNNSDGSDGSYFPGGLHWLTANPYSIERPCALQPLSSSSQFYWSWTEKPPELPFDAKTITAHAVHPRTGTIFVSATLGRVRRGTSRHGGVVRQGTYSYGMSGRGQWKRRSDCLLPFKGHAHYDNVLRAWVGLHHDSMSADGYLCVSSIVSRQKQLNWKVGREMLFLKHPHWRHVDAKLVHMREHNKYCVVECLVPEGVDRTNNMLRKKYVLRLTMFVVKYGEDGELKIMVHQPARFYEAPSYLCCFNIQAFWM